MGRSQSPAHTLARPHLILPILPRIRLHGAGRKQLLLLLLLPSPVRSLVLRRPGRCLWIPKTPITPPTPAPAPAASPCATRPPGLLRGACLLLTTSLFFLPLLRLLLRLLLLRLLRLLLTRLECGGCMLPPLRDVKLFLPPLAAQRHFPLHPVNQSPLATGLQGGLRRPGHVHTTLLLRLLLLLLGRNHFSPCARLLLHKSS